jgi:glycerol-3-phosphate dehydrogenase
MPHAPRVLIEILRWSAAAGARALNYFEATGLESGGGRVAGVTALDRESGRSFEFRARRVANCAGPWSRELSRRLDCEIAELFRPTVAFNLLLDREPPADLALALSPPGRSRSYFLVPWRGRLMVGTGHAAHPVAPRDLTADHPLVRELVRELSSAAPALELEGARVLRVLSGRLPAAAEHDASPASRPVIADHGRRGGPRGLVSASGVKYTTARALAERTLMVLFGAELPPIGAAARPEPAAWPSLAELTGSAGRDQNLSARLRRLAESEAVVHLEDIALRRTDLGLDPDRGAAATERLETLLASGPVGERTP